MIGNLLEPGLAKGRTWEVPGKPAAWLCSASALGLPGSRRSRRLPSSTSTPRKGSGRRPIKVASWSCSAELEPATRGPWGAQVAGGVVSFRTQAAAPTEKGGWGDRTDRLGDQTAEPGSATAAAPSSQQLFQTPGGRPEPTTTFTTSSSMSSWTSLLCGSLCSCSPSLCLHSCFQEGGSFQGTTKPTFVPLPRTSPLWPASL